MEHKIQVLGKSRGKFFFVGIYAHATLNCKYIYYIELIYMWKKAYAECALNNKEPKIK